LARPPTYSTADIACARWLLSSHRRAEQWLDAEHVEEERPEELKLAPGAELVDFERGRVKPRTIFNFSTGGAFFKNERIVCAAHLDVLNILP
jgi:hypothetical protein